MDAITWLTTIKGFHFAHSWVLIQFSNIVFNIVPTPLIYAIIIKEDKLSNNAVT